MGRPLGAQRVVVDGGLSLVRFPDDSTTVFGPSIRVRAKGQSGRLAGSASAGGVATFGASTGFATAEGIFRLPSSGAWSADLGGELNSVVGSTNGGASTTALAHVRALWSADAMAVWLRTSAYATGRETGTFPGHGIEVGTIRAWPRAQLTASVSREWTNAELFTARFRRGFAGTVPVRYTEGVLGLHVDGDRATLDLAVGGRRDPGAPQLYQSSVSATAAFWQSDTRAITVGLAHQLPDYIRGADAVDVISVGMRFLEPTPGAVRADRMRATMLVSEQASGDSTRIIRVSAPGAQRVELMADFTDWQPRALVARGEAFELSARLGPGSHRVLVRVNGGAWRPAANTPAVDDDLGGRVGLWVVPY
jgi:hypothetical protein